MTTEPEQDRKRMHGLAEQIDEYLRAEHAPPIWWHLSDLAHKAAGCIWDDAAGDLGAYDCESRPVVPVREGIDTQPDRELPCSTCGESMDSPGCCKTSSGGRTHTVGGPHEAAVRGWNRLPVEPLSASSGRGVASHVEPRLGVSVRFYFDDADPAAVCECGWDMHGDSATDAFRAWWKHRADRHAEADDA